MSFLESNIPWLIGELYTHVGKRISLHFDSVSDQTKTLQLIPNGIYIVGLEDSSSLIAFVQELQNLGINDFIFTAEGSYRALYVNSFGIFGHEAQCNFETFLMTEAKNTLILIDPETLKMFYAQIAHRLLRPVIEQFLRDSKTVVMRGIKYAVCHIKYPSTDLGMPLRNVYIRNSEDLDYRKARDVLAHVQASRPTMQLGSDMYNHILSFAGKKAPEHHSVPERYRDSSFYASPQELFKPGEERKVSDEPMGGRRLRKRPSKSRRKRSKTPKRAGKTPVQRRRKRV